MTVLPGQPYPDRPAWEDLSPMLFNGWGVPGEAQNLQAFVDGNTVTIFGRVQIGASTHAMVIPEHMEPIRQASLDALILRGPTCQMEIRTHPSNGRWNLFLSGYALNLSGAEMLEKYAGMYVSIRGSYPRRMPTT